MDGPAKISNFELSVDTQEQVLRFDVSMDDFSLVAVHQRTGEFRNILQNNTQAQ